MAKTADTDVVHPVRAWLRLWRDERIQMQSSLPVLTALEQLADGVTSSQELFVHAGHWLINDKGAVASAGRLPEAPANFADRACRRGTLALYALGGVAVRALAFSLIVAAAYADS